MGEASIGRAEPFRTSSGGAALFASSSETFLTLRDSRLSGLGHPSLAQVEREQATLPHPETPELEGFSSARYMGSDVFA